MYLYFFEGGWLSIFLSKDMGGGVAYTRGRLTRASTVYFFFFFQSESGGTVLSTNWKDIEKQKTEVKAPDGMEYKKYEY